MKKLWLAAGAGGLALALGGGLYYVLQDAPLPDDWEPPVMVPVTEQVRLKQVLEEEVPVVTPAEAVVGEEPFEALGNPMVPTAPEKPGRQGTTLADEPEEPEPAERPPCIFDSASEADAADC